MLLLAFFDVGCVAIAGESALVAPFNKRDDGVDMFGCGDSLLPLLVLRVDALV